MSWRRFCRRLKDVLKTSSKHLEDILKMSRRRFCKTSWRGFQNVLKTSWRHMAKTNILVFIKTSSEDEWLRRIYSSSSRHLLKMKTKDIFKTSSRPLHQDECLLGCFLFHFESSFCSQGIKFLVSTFWSCSETAW